jgi:aspartate racemase
MEKTRGNGRLLGVLGGMGPLAGTDFVAKLIRATPAARDADHIPVLLWSVPQVPDRLAAMDGRGDSPVPMLVDALHRMAACGVDRVAIACNTAHYWYGELVAAGGLPILHIADAAAEAVSALRPGDAAAPARRGPAAPLRRPGDRGGEGLPAGRGRRTDRRGARRAGFVGGMRRAWRTG